MKKTLFFAAMAAMMASCTNEMALEVSDSYAIGFDTHVGKATRAGDINTANLTTFYVFGGSAKGEFNGTEVKKSGSAWVYSPTQYWEENTNYNFAAIAPTKTGASYADKKLTVAAYTPGNEDLIVATTAEITGKATGQNSAVNLVFKHTLSKVQLSFTGGAEKLVKLSNVKLTGISNKANLEVTYGESTTPAWSTPADTDKDEYSLEINANGQGVKYLLPQSLEGAQVSFDYNGKTYTKALSVAGVEAWIMGNAYNYNFELKDQDAIDFTVEASVWPDYIGETPTTPSEDPTTPEEPGDDPEESGEVPSDITLYATAASWVRQTSPDWKGGAKADAMQIRNDLGPNVFMGLLNFELPEEDLNKTGYKLTANLKLVTTQQKGDASTNLYELGMGYDETAPYSTFSSILHNLAEEQLIANFTAAGQHNKAIQDGLDDAYKTIDKWTNTIDISEYLSSKRTSSTGKSLTFVITKANQDSNTNNNWNKFATNYATDITNTTLGVTFNADDLKPQLVITYTKE